MLRGEAEGAAVHRGAAAWVAGGAAAHGGWRGCCMGKKMGLRHGEAGGAAVLEGGRGCCARRQKGLLRSGRCIMVCAERQGCQ